MSSLVGDSRRHIFSWRGSYNISLFIQLGCFSLFALFLARLYEVQGELLWSSRLSTFASHCVKILCSSFSKVVRLCMTPKVLNHEQDCRNFILFKFWALKSTNLSFDKSVETNRSICERTNHLSSSICERTNYLSNDKIVC